MIRRPSLVSSEEIDLLLEWRRTSESEEAAGLVPLVAVIGEREISFGRVSCWAEQGKQQRREGAS